MRTHWLSAAKALPFVTLFLTAIFTTSSVRADWGIYQSYIIVNAGGGNAYYAGGYNSDNATAFDALNLGTFAQGASLTLNGGELKTWKNGNNGNSNVCGGTLFYRVYANGLESGDYTGVTLSYAGELGGGNQKWDATASGIELASWLAAGDYVLDVWWQAEGNQHGGCGEFKYDSNSGANFQATFTICPSGLRADGTCLTGALSLKGIIDFTVPSGGNDGKAIHVVANEDIADLSAFGLGVANNGEGSDGVEYTFPSMAVSAGDDILVARSSSAMESYFGACYGGFEHVLAANGNIGQNGDDAIELFESTTAIETFGDVNVSGAGQAWEYTDSWAYHDGTSWTYGTPNCTDGTTTIYDSGCMYPMCSAASASGLFGTPLSTAAHNFATTTTPADAPNPDRWGANLSAPYPTNAWWQDLTLVRADGSSYGRINCLPYQFRAVDNAMDVWMPEISYSSTVVNTQSGANWKFTAEETGLTHKITAYDELSVGVTFSNGSSGTFFMPLVRGMAYASSQYLGLTPKLETPHAILGIQDDAGNNLSQATSFSGQAFTVTLNNGQTWKLYSNQSITWNWNGQSLTSTAVESDVWVRMALLNASNLPTNWPSNHYIGQNQSVIEGLLDAHASAIPVGGSVNATVNDNQAALQFTWSHAIGSSGNFLVYALPHHQDILSESTSDDLWIRTIRGVMKAVSAESWTLTEPLSTITWNAPRPIPESRKPAVQEALKLSENFTASSSSIYFGGKQLQGLSRLVLIADELGLTSDVTTFKTQLNSDLGDWLNGTVTYPLHYDTEWGGIIPGPDFTGSAPDDYITFGVDYYNDHHFQYGHLIYAAAVLAKDDPTWVTQHGDVVMQLVRNIATPSHDDPNYPFMRNKDWFVGHSLATGVRASVNNDGRDQESSSEAVNAWYAVSLYGLAIGDERLHNLGRLMLATELRSVHKYWQIQDADDIYPPEFEANKVVGRLFDTKVDYAVWFADNSEGGVGSKTEWIHGIQYLPITPFSEELLRPEWMQEAYPVVSAALSDPTIGEDWKSLIFAAHGTIAPADAWDETMTLTGTDDGNPPANALHWAATRPNLPEETLAPVSSDLATVQFSVDLSQVSTVASPVVKVYVGGAFVDYALTDGDGDGVYTAEASLAMGAHKYKFFNNGEWETIDASHTCAVESGGYYNREVEVTLGQSLFSETISLPTVCWSSCSECSEAPTAPESLSITATVCTSASSVQLTGPFWGWQTTSIPAAVDNGDGTWTFTMDTPTADMEYLLIVDGVEENLIPEASGSCVGVTDYSSYANRLWTVGSGDVTGIVYGTCASTCGGVPGCTDATACNYDSAATTDDGSCQGIPSGDCDCNGNQADACGVCGGSGTDVDADGICDDVDECTDTSACNYAADPTEPCTPCTTESVVFQVDVSDEPYSGELLVYMFGSFQASPWNIASATALQDPDGDGTFSVTLALQAGTTLEYKFLIGDGSYVETLASGASCTLTTGQYTNRVYTVPTGGATLDAVCFGSCDVCPETGCMDATACNYDSNATSDDGSCVFVVDVCDVCNGDGSVTQPDSDGDGICDASDSCSDTSACNYNDSANGACQTIDACGVCGGSGTDLDGDGVCDDSDNCTDTTACNYNDSANGACQTVDACGVCGGSGTDVDGDGVCDDTDNCTDTTACNYNDSSNGTCQLFDACGVCGGSGTDVDGDGVCDDLDNCTDVTACNYNDSANGACQTIDACGVCGGSGTDVDGDGVCDDLDNCTDVTACNYSDSANGACQTVDACGICGGSGTDVDGDGVCDDADNCTDTTACNYNDSANGACQTVDACGVCGGSGTDVDGDGVCDDTDNCTDVTACNYNDPSNPACDFDLNSNGVCDALEPQDSCIDEAACNYGADTACLYNLGPAVFAWPSGTETGQIWALDDTYFISDIEWDEANGVYSGIFEFTNGTNPGDSFNNIGHLVTMNISGGSIEVIYGGNSVFGYTFETGGFTLTLLNNTDVAALSECCESDSDADGICDDVDTCDGIIDGLGVCGGNCPSDYDGDGICDVTVTPGFCIDEAACNYGAEAACLYNLGPAVFDWPTTPDSIPADSATSGQIWSLDNSYWITDIQWDEANGVYLGIFEFANGTNLGDSFNNIGHLVTMNISGSSIDVIYGGNSVFGYTSETGGFTLNLLDNTVIAALSECCAFDVDGDGVCDDVDTCEGIIDALGVCAGDCLFDLDEDGICDDVDDCLSGAVDAVGVCGGACLEDLDNNGICDTDDIIGCMDVNACNYNADATSAGTCLQPATGYDCSNNCLNDTDLDGVCDEFEVAGCQDSAACNYDPLATDSNGTCTYAGSGVDCAGNCLLDLDQDGLCDYLDNCANPSACNYDDPTATGCWYDDDSDGLCDNLDNCADTSACNYDDPTASGCWYDIDGDGLCDNVDNCPDTSACNYSDWGATSCWYDTDNDGLCDDVDNCPDTTACNYNDWAATSCSYDYDNDGLCDNGDNCLDTSACNYDDWSATTCWYDSDSDGVCDNGDNCLDTSACNYDDWSATTCWYDSDSDGVCDNGDNCLDTSACNYDDWSATTCWYDSDSDGVCDNGDNCTDTMACNYDDWSATTCWYDSDSDGVCDNGDNCTDTTACNYNDSTNGTCQTIDACGVCGGNGTDADSDGVCDDVDNCTDTTACNYNDSANGTCQTLDDCGVCGGSGIASGACDCDGNQNDALGVCGGTCVADADSDGICDDVDDCVGTPDALGVCNGTCTADANNDGICDSDAVPGCTDATACNYNEAANVDDGNCTYATTWYADADGDGTGHTYTFVQACTAPAGYVAISGDTCPDDANKLSPGTCGCGNVDVDVDADGLCDTVDGCTDNTACNYDNLTATACLTINTCGNCAAPTTVTCGLQGACNYDSSGDCFNDDLCDFDSCAGCMNNTACNYDATATISAPLTCTFPAYAWENCSGECLNDADANGVCDEVEIPGCMDSAAINYNPNASTDDGSCFTEIVGCIIPSATNYDPAATIQGSPLTTYCTFPSSVPVPWFLMTNPGCMDSSACNYDDTATTSDGSCEYTSCQGCDVAGACNYDASVLYNDGSCEWTSCQGCMNSSACDYDATATIADTCDFDSCQGCTNSAASNYDATATQDDGSCIIDGCTNASACNYDATATNNDGSCIYAAAYYDCNGDCNNDTDSDGVCDELEVSGCTNSSACNYDALATDDDGLCTLPTTWYQDLDGDGSGDASATQEACVQPVGYVSSAGDNCPSNASKTDPGLCGCGAADVDTDSDGLCDTSDNCTDTTSCNYDDSANEACAFATTYYQDADGDGMGNASVSNAVCSDTPPTGYVADNTDNCDNLLADNYNDGGNPACTFASGADYAAQDSLLLCDGGSLSIDLDTLHTGSQAGTWSYSLNGALDAFGSATISGSVLTVDGSANGTGRDTLSVSGAGNSETADLTIIVQESTYPVVTGQYVVLPSSPVALDGGVQFTFEGHYDAPVAVHFLHHPTDTTDADGSLILRSDAYWISAFTNDKGCSNPAPATSTIPTESTTPKAMAIPYVLED